MATVNKDFKIKNGLVVEGSTATVNGNQVLTENASDQYIIDLIGGETLVTSVESTQMEVINGELNIKSGVFDPAGTADSAISSALEPGTGSIDAAIQSAVPDNTDGLSEGINNLYFTNQRALDATSSAYDAAGAADTVQTNLTNHRNATSAHGVSGDIVGTTDTQTLSSKTLNNPSVVVNISTNEYTIDSELAYLDGVTSNIQTQLDNKLESADLSGYATETYVSTAIDNLVDGAPGLLDTLNEIAAAINDDENYATTMTTALAGKQDELTAGTNISIVNDVISVTGLASTDISDFATAAQSAGTGYFDPAGSAQTAEDNAKQYADGLAVNYDAAGTADTAISNALAANGSIDLAIMNAVPDDTDGLSEGVNNLYFTDSRAKSAAMELLVNSNQDNITIAYNNMNDGLVITAENGVADSDTDDLTEGSTNLYFTDQRALDAVSGADITPNTVTIDTYRKEEATQQYVANASTVNVHSLPAGFESAKYLVRVVGSVAGTKHSQLTEILLTTDGNNNIAITEYGTICTDTNNLASFSATMAGSPSLAPTLTATTAVAGCEIIAAATMLSWAD